MSEYIQNVVRETRTWIAQYWVKNDGQFPNEDQVWDRIITMNKNISTDNAEKVLNEVMRGII